MTRAELLQRMSSQEMSEWQGYFILENEERERQNLARQARTGAKSRMRR